MARGTGDLITNEVRSARCEMPKTVLGIIQDVAMREIHYGHNSRQALMA